MFVSRNWLHPQRAGHLFEKQTTVRNSFSLLTSLPRDLLCVSHSTTAIPARNNKITEPKRIYQVGRGMQFALLQLDLAITSEISTVQRFVSFTKQIPRFASWRRYNQPFISWFLCKIKSEALRFLFRWVMIERIL